MSNSRELKYHISTQHTNTNIPQDKKSKVKLQHNTSAEIVVGKIDSIDEASAQKDTKQVENKKSLRDSDNFTEMLQVSVLQNTNAESLGKCERCGNDLVGDECFRIHMEYENMLYTQSKTSSDA